MSSPARGDPTSEAEVTHISAHGLWLLSKGKEYFLSYDDFPWFKDQPVKSIINVEEPTPGHFYWPEMDVDLTENIIENPGRYPLTAGTGSDSEPED